MGITHGGGVGRRGRTAGACAGGILPPRAWPRDIFGRQCHTGICHTSYNDKIELLFTDIGLKDDLEAGLNLAVDAVAKYPGLKVLYTTGQTVTDGMRALFVPKSAMLVKPYTVEQLLTSLSMLGINHRAP